MAYPRLRGSAKIKRQAARRANLQAFVLIAFAFAIGIPTAWAIGGAMILAGVR